MSLYGYENAISAGSAFNSRTQSFNDGVIARNQVATENYNEKVKNVPGKRATDQTKEDEDAAFYGISDAKGVTGSVIGAIKEGQKLKDSGGILSYAAQGITERTSAIRNTASRLGDMSIGKAQEALKPSAEGAGGLTEATDDIASDAGRNAAKAASEEIESSGMGTGILKGVLKKAAMGTVSEAGLSAASEIGGKIAGDFGGGLDIIDGIKNMANGSSFFAGEDKTATLGDTLQSVGAVTDVVGTVFPPAEIIGGALGAIGGVIDAYDSISNDISQKRKDAADPKPPSLTAVKVTPAFSAMGLVASAPISAKQSITGQ